ncbi:MAG TPA: class II fumarate hydratase [Phycisphaerae bacterium]|nr:class II fumarate hydratase [Phycisphaerae bacterium]HRW55016.1 class II fumarate hydratase [Phycisphaerae bacterium]
MSEPTRIEKDSMGEMTVPAHALWGASTQRAVENFPISGYRFGRRYIRALGLIKQAAAMVNAELGVVPKDKCEMIARAADEVIEGRLDDHFVVDIFQTGSGTSTNMNANEVIANRAIQMAGGRIGSKDPVHPNDHVNQGQSSNDVIPTAMHVAAAESLRQDLLPAVEKMAAALEVKARAFDNVVKIGRTHLQDATPIRLGQEFSGYAAQMRMAVERCKRAMHALRELPLGGTAVGTGINTHKQFGGRVAKILSEKTGVEFVEAANHFEAQHAKDGFVEASGLLRAIAISMSKIANDIRFLASGPRCGIGEISIPETQPGSSIMPGKVNPVMCEMVLQSVAHAIGADAAITHAAATMGNFDLHVGMPIMAYHFNESVRILSSAARVFTDRCVSGIEVNQQRAEQLVEQSLAMCTSLAPVIGYDNAAAIAKEAFKTGKTVRQVALEKGVVAEDELKKLLDPRDMTHPTE